MYRLKELTSKNSGLIIYQMARQKSDGRAPIIALISLENRETPTTRNEIF